MAEASQHSPLMTHSFGHKYSYSRRCLQNGGVISPQRPTPGTRSSSPTVSVCIDLTAYGDMNEERDGCKVSSGAEIKIDEGSSSNCENEAAVAVDNIKNLLELGDNDDIIVGSSNLAQKVGVSKKHMGNQVDRETMSYHPFESTANRDGPIHLWTPETHAQQQDFHRPIISEYQRAKNRLNMARRDASSRRSVASLPDMKSLTRKHEQLVEKSTEYKKSIADVIEIIHIENDQVIQTTKSCNSRLFIDTSDMERILDDNASPQKEGNDLLSAFAYEFKKKGNDEQSDIIVIDDILAQKKETKHKWDVTRAEQNVAARYEAIRDSVSGRLNFEKTRVHPLSPSMPMTERKHHMESQDLSIAKINSIRDHVKLLQQQNAADESVQSTGVGLQTNDKSKCAITSSPSKSFHSFDRSSVIEGLINASGVEPKADQLDIDSEDGEAIDTEAEHIQDKNIFKEGAIDGDALLSMLVSNKESDVPVIADPNVKAIPKDLPPPPSSNEPTKVANVADTINSLEETYQYPESNDDKGNNGSSQTEKEEPLSGTMKDVSELDNHQEITYQNSQAVVAADDLCLGFCSNNGDDTISVPDKINALSGDTEDVPSSPAVATIVLKDAMLPFVQEYLVNSPSHCKSLAENSTLETVFGGDDLLKKCTSVATVIEGEISMARNHKLNEKDHDTGSIYIDDLAISVDESSSSYQSDVEPDIEIDVDDVQPGNGFQKESAIILHSGTADSNKLPRQSMSKAVKVVSPMNITAKKYTEASTSDNGSYVTDYSETRASLGDSDNSDSDLDDEAGIYDTCFARQFLDVTCAWLENEETSFCFKPSLLKKVKRRNVGPMSKGNGRSPLLLRIPRKTNLSQNFIDTRRKATEKYFFRSRQNAKKGTLQTQDSPSRSARSRRNQIVFGSGANAKNEVIVKPQYTPAQVNDANGVAKEQQEIHDFVTPTSSNLSKAMMETTMDEDEDLNISGRINSASPTTFGVVEVDSINMGVLGVKSADEYVSRHFKAYEHGLRSRSMSPRTFQLTSHDELRRQVLNGLEDHKGPESSDQNCEVPHSGMKYGDANEQNKNGASVQKTSAPLHQIQENVIVPIDCTVEGSDSIYSHSHCSGADVVNNEDEQTSENDAPVRPKSRREGLAKLRRHHPSRHESVVSEKEDSRTESVSIVSLINEEQRLAALDLAEKLRRRATTLKRRRKVRERRKELRCTDSYQVCSPIGDSEISA
jgi:hypothetical protein